MTLAFVSGCVRITGAQQAARRPFHPASRALAGLEAAVVPVMERPQMGDLGLGFLGQRVVSTCCISKQVVSAGAGDSWRA
jgi:hypothetical protein